MNEKELKIVLGGLLHDVGKVLHRTGVNLRHSESGGLFLKEDAGIEDKDILDCVRYHHKAEISGGGLPDDSIAYITYIADNIASATDRRKNDSGDYGFSKSMPLQPVFNILNGNNKSSHYHPQMIKDEPNFPTEKSTEFDEGFYLDVKNSMQDALKAVSMSEEYVNSVINVLETTCSYVPSSTSKDEVADISLFDHVKLTAAISSCIYQYLKSMGRTDLNKELYVNEDNFMKEQAFLLFEADLSGIQDFIYTIHSKNALKMLRARSFYLEILMEHVIDTLLEKLSLSRANLMYSGGGHCYLILPNTEKVIAETEAIIKEINQWLIDRYDISLYLAYGYAPASADTFKNIPEGSYRDLFRNVGRKVGQKKENRYSHKDIISMNDIEPSSYERECRVCKTLGDVDGDGLCSNCCALIAFSTDIINKPFFVITSAREEGAVALPGGAWLVAETKEELLERMKKGDGFIRAYSKNRFYTGLNVASKLWVADYTTGQSFEDLAAAAEGVDRIAVIRADVDNLGLAFTNGFEERFNTLSRTATLSRQLSVFFKKYINSILENSEDFADEKGRKRNAAIVYSGGDDLFIVGAWNDVIGMAMDINETFSKYTLGTLTISAGIGLYPHDYPISQIAVDTGELEHRSKLYSGKNALTVFDDSETHDDNGTDVYNSTYRWDEFVCEVIGEKYNVLRDFFDNSEEHGKAFLYHILELIRGRGDRINFARFVYLLARLEPKPGAPSQEKEDYKVFSRHMYEWIRSEKDCRQLVTAIYLYVYMIREKGDN